ncbi:MULTISPECIES: ATP-dependent nuclease [Psychrilyobacter]|uniref:ATP-dependent endonuclease n=1 Tax=Psychrilyobacter piezotolerans TaxID=2293438 RepID=A0ABX9KI57_9FUSO|nr:MULTISPECIES: AAA family ATPase [Psychrilyobacter]MCS5420221.1 AAA family ATPase [Psychrilyobacter sp. S5]NDI77246.1 AAA family ATPase [Psychrilyobacter piezotolerans]RDE63304.1 ATP-dependent endonuclease [Psychrilyobacter sp. S5]REI41846.1 ATP-dependent endonuclease [Psychrilyobacter piezotolerans]
MHIKNLTIKNWKSIDETHIEFENFLLFIGQSNHGKSNILSAILLFFDKIIFKNKHSYRMNIPTELIITFDSLRLKELNVFKDIKNTEDEIVIKKVLSADKKQYFYKNNNEFHPLSEHLEYYIRENIEIIFIPSFSASSNKTILDIYEKIILVLTNNNKLVYVEKLIDKLDLEMQYLEERYASRGLQREVMFRMMRRIASVTKSTRYNLLGNTIIMYEEPELYLHPQAERELHSVMTNIARYGGQIYVTTHSSSFIELNNYKSICLVRKNDDGTHVMQHKGDLFKGDEIKNFNMNYWMNPDRGELFFAKKVILVEGQTDKIIIPFLAKKLGVYKYEYSIVECGSKSSIPQFIRLLNEYKIPYVAVYDKDEHLWRDYESKIKSRRDNKYLKQLIHENIGEIVEFTNDIEEELEGKDRIKKNYKNKPFIAIKNISGENYIVPDGLKKKILKIYK